MFRLQGHFLKALTQRSLHSFGVCIPENTLTTGLQRLRESRPVAHLFWSDHKLSHSLSPALWIVEENAGSRQERKALMEGKGDHAGPAADMEQISVSKKKKVKKMVRKPWACKKKMKESDCAMKLLAELPFTSTEVWKELGFSDPDACDKEKRKRKKGRQAETEEEGKEGEKKKKDVPRPNYFVSIPITNPKIKQGVKDLQAEILQKDPRLSRGLIPVATLHITLLVTHLATQEAVETAALAVEEMKSTLMSLVGGQALILPFRGISHFRQEVAFIQIEDGEHVGTLTRIADSVRSAFEKRGIPTGDQKDFKPHLTFIKLSRAAKLRRQGIKKLNPALFTAFEQHLFGEEKVCSLDLCSMLKKKDTDGYYHREKTVTFDLVQSARRTSRTSGKRGTELDDEELLSLSKRLVDDAVSRAVQQYMEETQQNGVAPKEEAPPTGGSNK